MSQKSKVSNGDFWQKTFPSKREAHPETAGKKIGADPCEHQGEAVPTGHRLLFKISRNRKVKLQHFVSRTLFGTHHVRGKQRTVLFTSG